MAIVTWKQLIQEKMEDNSETYADIEYQSAIPQWRELLYDLRQSDTNWDAVEFDNGHGDLAGFSFIVYTKNWIYFPVCYNGSEWVGSVPRNPNPDWQPDHFGG